MGCLVDVITSITDILNNREIAVAIWLLILFIWAMSKGSIRHSFLGVLRALFAKKMILAVVCILLYTLLIVIVLERIGFWDTSAVKDTILWFFGVAFVMLVNVNEVVADENYFRKTVVDNVKLILILEFVANLYSFNLAVELVVVPIVSFIVMMNTYAGLKPEHKQAKVLLDYALGLFGIVLIVFTIREISTDFQNFATLKNMRDFLLPIVFTIAFLPFTYLMALFVQYESIFTSIEIVNTDSVLARYTKWNIFAACRLNLRKLNKFSKDVRLLRMNSREDVLALMEKFKNG